MNKQIKTLLGLSIALICFAIFSILPNIYWLAITPHVVVKEKGIIIVIRFALLIASWVIFILYIVNNYKYYKVSKDKRYKYIWISLLVLTITLTVIGIVLGTFAAWRYKHYHETAMLILPHIFGIASPMVLITFYIWNITVYRSQKSEETIENSN